MTEAEHDAAIQAAHIEISRCAMEIRGLDIAIKDFILRKMRAEARQQQAFKRMDALTQTAADLEIAHED